MTPQEAAVMAAYISRACGNVPVEVGANDTGHPVVRVVWPVGIVHLVSVRECVRYVTGYQIARQERERREYGA